MSSLDVMREPLRMMAGRPGNGAGIEEIEPGVATRPRPKTKKPSNYKVLMLNDFFLFLLFVVLVFFFFFFFVFFFFI